MCTLSLGCVFERWRNQRSAPPPPPGQATEKEKEKEAEREIADVGIDADINEKGKRRDVDGADEDVVGDGASGSAEGSAVVQEREVKE